MMDNISQLVTMLVTNDPTCTCFRLSALPFETTVEDCVRIFDILAHENHTITQVRFEGFWKFFNILKRDQHNAIPKAISRMFRHNHRLEHVSFALEYLLNEKFTSVLDALNENATVHSVDIIWLGEDLPEQSEWCLSRLYPLFQRTVQQLRIEEYSDNTSFVNIVIHALRHWRECPCQNLKKLRFALNNPGYISEFLKVLGETAPSLPQLRSIKIYFDQNASVTTERMPPEFFLGLSRMQSPLESLSLGRFCLDSDQIIGLLHGLKQRHTCSLATIHLHQNLWHGPRMGGCMLAQGIQSLRSLQTLGCSVDNMEDVEFEEFCTLLESHPTLSAVQLDVSFQQPHPNPCPFFTLLTRNHQWKEVSLGGFRLYSNEDWAPRLAVAIERNEFLSRLNLTLYRGPAESKAICESLRKNHTLKCLRLAKGPGQGDHEALTTLDQVLRENHHITKIERGPDLVWDPRLTPSLERNKRTRLKQTTILRQFWLHLRHRGEFAPE